MDFLCVIQKIAVANVTPTKSVRVPSACAKNETIKSNWSHVRMKKDKILLYLWLVFVIIFTVLLIGGKLAWGQKLQF